MKVHIEIAEDKVITEITFEDDETYVSGNFEKCRLSELKPEEKHELLVYLIRQQINR